MTTKRKSRNMRIEPIPLDETIIQFFFSGEKPERGTPAWSLYISRHFDWGEKIRVAWLQHKKFLLRKWKVEGRGLSWAARKFNAD